MSVNKLQVYEILKSRFSESEAKLIAAYFDEKAEEKYLQKKDILATKEDIGVVRKEIAESKADLIKWSFVFWIGTIMTILGGLFAILKLFFNKSKHLKKILPTVINFSVLNRITNGYPL